MRLINRSGTARTSRWAAGSLLAIAAASASAQTASPPGQEGGAPAVAGAGASVPQSEASASSSSATGQVQEQGTTGDIIVTAQKREQTLSDVPLSITAVSGDQLLARGITDVASLVKVTPGLSFVESGNAVPVYSLRGVGFFDTALGARPTVSVYDDETPLPFSIMSVGASFDLQRVEVLKGPQGTLFGQNATGGAINYIAAKPTQNWEGGATASYGRFNTIDATGYVSGPLTSTLRARIAARGLRGDDWQYSYTRRDGLGAKRFVQGRLLLDWTPSDRLKFAFNANGFHDTSDTQAGQLTEVLLQIPRNAGRVPLLTAYPLSPNNPRAADWNFNEDLRRNNKFYQLALRGDYELSDDLTLTSITAYSKMTVRQRIDQDGTALTNSASDVSGRLSSFSQEVRLSGDLGPVQLVVGANYARDKSREYNLYDVSYATVAFALPTGQLPLFNLTNAQNFDTKAVFASADLNLTDTLVAHGGVRYTDAKLAYAACSRAANTVGANTLTSFFNILRRGAGLAPLSPLQVGDCITVDATVTPRESVGNLNQDNVSWRVGLDWKPAPQTLIYANVSKGYKSGSIPAPPALSTEAFRPVTQESLVAYEIGFKLPVVRRVLEATGALFYYDYTDKQVLGRVLTPPTQLGALQALVNIPKSRIQGAEFQLNAFPTAGLTLTLAGTYLDTKVTKDFVNYTITALQTNFRGNRFPYTPKYQLVADGQYEAPVTDTLVGLVGASVNYRSKTTAGFGDIPSLAIDDYALLDMRAGIRAQDRRWQAMLFMRNVTNTYYWTNVARLTDTIRRYAGEPRTYGVQLSTRF